MSDWLASLLIAAFFIMGFWLGVHWVQERME